MYKNWTVANLWDNYKKNMRIFIGKKRLYDKAHLTWDDNNGGWEGIVYAYTLDCPGDPKDGWGF